MYICIMWNSFLPQGLSSCFSFCLKKCSPQLMSPSTNSCVRINGTSSRKPSLNHPHKITTSSHQILPLYLILFSSFIYHYPIIFPLACRWWSPCSLLYSQVLDQGTGFCLLNLSRTERAAQKFATSCSSNIFCCI